MFRSLMYLRFSAAVATVMGAWMSEILVGAAEATGQALELSPAFIGMIIMIIIASMLYFVPALN